MKKIDYGSNRVVYNIFQSVIPLMVAQILIILYNVVDRFYIGRIPVTGTVALGGVGVCFPLIILITGFTNMFGMGGTPLFSMAAGAGKKDMARDIQNTSFVLLIISAVVLMVIGEIWVGPILDFFGAGPENLVYAKSYFEIYLAGNIFAMLSGGMNPYITAQGFPYSASARTPPRAPSVGAAFPVRSTSPSSASKAALFLKLPSPTLVPQ